MCLFFPDVHLLNMYFLCTSNALLAHGELKFSYQIQSLDGATASQNLLSLLLTYFYIKIVHEEYYTT